MKSLDDKITEIHSMLVKICNYIDKVESSEYQNKKDEKNFIINVIADLFVDRLNDCKDK